MLIEGVSRCCHEEEEHVLHLLVSVRTRRSNWLGSRFLGAIDSAISFRDWWEDHSKGWFKVQNERVTLVCWIIWGYWNIMHWRNKTRVEQAMEDKANIWVSSRNL